MQGSGVIDRRKFTPRAFIPGRIDKLGISFPANAAAYISLLRSLNSWGWLVFYKHIIPSGFCVRRICKRQTVASRNYCSLLAADLNPPAFPVGESAVE